MGAEDTQKKGFFSTKATFRNRSTIFTLGSRDTVLTTELEDPIIVIPHAQKTDRKVSGGRGVVVRGERRRGRGVVVRGEGGEGGV